MFTNFSLDMLDEFSTVKIDQPKPAQAAASSKPEAPKDPAPSGKQPEVEDAFSEEEFAKQLQAGMADLLGELDQSVSLLRHEQTLHCEC